ncbi:MAG: hypothetical protein C0619_03045 [Desulfuromonas sp.]|nr:MAG: hypothetical protein C0619_03045 [Desulfuromonas sp.]
MQQIPETEILHACRVLFGADLHLGREFLNYLQPSCVRTAYRKQAKATHPDRYTGSCSSTRARQEKLFQNLNQAHEVIQNYLKQRNLPSGETRFRTSRQQPPPSPPENKAQRYYRGPLPTRPLQFGQFLYYRGVIPYSAVISAITWQRQQRPPIGEIARRWRWLNSTDVDRILRQHGGFARFGERAERLGLLNSLQVRTLLLHQRNRQQQIGHYFIERNYFPESSLDRFLTELSEHNRSYSHGNPGQFYTQR